MELDSRITELKGIGEKTAEAFARLDIYTVGDLIAYFPRSYEIYEEPRPLSACEVGSVCAARVFLDRPVKNVGNGKRMLTTTRAADEEGSLLYVSWFHMPYLKHSLASGQELILRGRLKERAGNGSAPSRSRPDGRGVFFMEHPEIFSPPENYEEKLHTMQPVYPLTAGVTNRLLVKTIRQALGMVRLADPLPEDLRRRYALAAYGDAVRGMHFPCDREMYADARRRLAFEEFFQFIYTLRREKARTGRSRNPYAIRRLPEVEEFLASLPYALTGAQKRAWAEIRADLTGPYAASRLLQGDVGSGKTILAAAALLLVALQGFQGAMMAPTEVLAKQHYESLTKLFARFGASVSTVLLTGSMTAKEKREAYARIESGEANVILGTHALIQEAVIYRSLALVITDEQHRFGVRQRELFSQKGARPHILVMSATPIPRTLAIILYGDLDISVIDELPAERLPIKNCVVGTEYRPTAYRFIGQQIKVGRQCYVICAMVEESENAEAENVTDYTARLRETFGSSVRIESLHGRMKQAEKDAVMQAFSDNRIQILVSTTVVEVGVNVPNATVMLIENAERFGLAQLHQLRGRVGRGNFQSYCIFMSGTKNPEIRKRLGILNRSNDGFYIAAEDLKLRGPGDLLGIRQSGAFGFCVGDVFQDADLLKLAAEAADLCETDPALGRAADAYVKKRDGRRFVL